MSDPERFNRAAETPLPPPAGVSRRAAFLSALGALAAGVLAAFGLNRLSTRLSAEHEPFVESELGRWIKVAHVSDVPGGAIRPFTAGAVQGFLINHGGQYQALSRLCTHMGCALAFNRSQQSFVCPCHGAQFALNGRQRFGRDPHRLTLRSLPEIDVRVRGDSIQVWAV